MNCADCKYFWFEGPSHDQPYPEFACTKGHWEGGNDTDSFYDEIDCKDYHKRTIKKRK